MKQKHESLSRGGGGNAPADTTAMATDLFDAFDALVATLKAAPREGVNEHTLMMPRENVSQAIYAFRDAMKAALLKQPAGVPPPAAAKEK